MERLQKVIANSGFTSRRKAEELILAGRVKVNGEVVTKLGVKVEKSDKIEVDGIPLKSSKLVYYLLYKPKNILSTTTDDRGRTTVVDLIPEEERIYPVGRLDYDTTGLLLLTNDGEFTNLMTHPRNKIEKTYEAKIKGILSVENLKKLEQGIMLDGKKTLPAQVKIKNIDKKKEYTNVKITLYEGRNHQVKKMFKSVGHKIIKLKRTQFGFLTLGNLIPGEYRKLTQEEVQKLKLLANKGKKRVSL
ncbi:MAG TPA: rRNA pseudouridine synthase [Tenericutes bacterium]|jgi:23S rRNA pseudouridine2605 synthase|nr:rRNA pseudouridine synthase [Mycoplasmatota bacterium]